MIRTQEFGFIYPTICALGFVVGAVGPEIQNILFMTFLFLETEHGEEFIPRLIHALPVRAKSVNLQKPTLNDVFLKLTGRTIRDEVLSNDAEITREFVRSHRRAQR